MALARPPLLLDKLRESGLLEQDRIKELSILPEAREADPRALGLQVLKRGWLTRYQINAVAQGRGKDLLVGPYLLLDRLGEGGMGQVFKARHQRMHRVVALKIIRKEKLAGPSAVDRFHQEVRAAAQLVHPNIVVAYDAGNFADTHYLAMEYVDGMDLARLVKESGPLSVPTACDFIRQAAQGLQHAHERGLVHRDIKPHNLLVTRARPDGPGAGTPSGDGRSDAARGGMVKILDMGLARRQEFDQKERAVTQIGAVIGTPDYLAPEQAVDSRAADIRSDLYSLGCTFYYLLTGLPPFEAESLTELLLKHQLEPSIPIEERRPDVPAGVARIIHKLMAKRPEDRFQNPAELISALETIGGDQRDVSAWVQLPKDDTAHQDTLWASLTDEVADGTDDLNRKSIVIGKEKAAKGRDRHKGSASPVLSGSRRTIYITSAGVAVLLCGAAIVGWTLFARGNRTTPEEPPQTSNLDSGAARQIAAAISSETNGKQAPTPIETPKDVQQAPQTTAVRDAPRTLREAKRFDGHKGPVTSIAMSADGRWAVSTGEDKSLRLWDLETGADKGGRVQLDTTPRSIAIRADGGLVYAAMGDFILTWEPTTGRTRKIPNNKGEYLSPDGHLILGLGLVGWDNQVWVGDLVLGKVLVSATSPHLFDFSADFALEGSAAVVGGSQGIVLYFDVERQKWRRWGIENAGRTAVGLAANGRLVLAACESKGLRLLDPDTGKLIRLFEGKPGLIWSATISPDGRYALTAGDDRMIRLWDIEKGVECRRFEGHTAAVLQVAFTTNGKQALSAGADGFLRLWDLPVPIDVTGVRRWKPKPAATVTPAPEPQAAPAPTTEKALRRLDGATKGSIQAMTFVPRAGTLIAASWDDLTFWNWSKGQLVNKVATKEHRPACFALSPDGSKGLSGSFNKSLRLWDMKTCKPLRDLPGHMDPIWCVEFSADGKRALSAGGSQNPGDDDAAKNQDCAVRVWDMGRVQEICRFKGHTSYVRHVAFLPDGRHVLSAGFGETNSICIWDATTGKEVRRLAKQLKEPVAAATTSGDGRSLLLGSYRIARIWDVETDQEMRRLNGHVGFVTKTAFSRDGKYALTAEVDNQGKKDAVVAMHLWEVSTGRELRRYPKHPSEIRSIAFTPDGSNVLSGYDDGTILIWETGIQPTKP